MKKIWGLLKDTFKEWGEDKAPRLAAALAYYTVFSIAPFIVIVIAVTGLIFGSANAQAAVMGQIASLVGPAGAEALQTMIASTSKMGDNRIAAVAGLGLLLVGAAGLFGQLQDALNTIWEVKPKPSKGILTKVREKFLSFTVVLGVAFLLLVSMVVSAGLAAAGKYAEGLLPGLHALMLVANFTLSFVVIAILFALIYKILPKAWIAWKDALVGGAATAFLFILGEFGVSFYLGRGNYANVYGAAASLVIFLVWVYYTTQILFFGAEITQVYANKYGSGIVPEKDAEKVTEQDRAEQGIPPQNLEKESLAWSHAAQTLPQTGAGRPSELKSLPRVESSPADRGVAILGGIVLSLFGAAGAVLVAGWKRR